MFEKYLPCKSCSLKTLQGSVLVSFGIILTQCLDTSIGCNRVQEFQHRGKKEMSKALNSETLYLLSRKRSFIFTELFRFLKRSSGQKTRRFLISHIKPIFSVLFSSYVEPLSFFYVTLQSPLSARADRMMSDLLVSASIIFFQPLWADFQPRPPGKPGTSGRALREFPRDEFALLIILFTWNLRIILIPLGYANHR